jgi:hypothetical protein
VLRAARGIRRELLTAAAALAFVLACAGRASAQLDERGRWENGVTESWWLDPETFADAEKLNAAALWKSIGEANALDAGDARAGDYFVGGDTSGAYMRWSPRAGFVIAYVNKCEARVRALVYGRVKATPTLVEFFPEFYKVQPRKREGEGEERKAAATPEVIRFVTVEWRGERLLIKEDEMEDFGDYLAGLGRYNGQPPMAYDDGYANFFTRVEVRGEAEDSDDGAAYAPPVVPPGYERFLKKPVEATVTAVGRRSVKRDYTVGLINSSMYYERASVTRVTIGAGTAQGVKDRMAFRVTEPDEGELVVVLRAGENESEAIVVRELNELGAETYHDDDADREKKHSKVSAGWKLTTNPF